MPNLTIVGVAHDVDGTYPLDLTDQFTYGETRTIKQISGARVLELNEAMTAGDSDVILALAKIALDRAGKDVPVDILLRAKIDSITLEPTAEEQAAEEEADALPPSNALSNDSETNSESATSGSSTTNGSEGLPETDLRATGELTLATGVTFDRQTSET